MITKFKCHVSKVLPTVFDDSLSYYEVVCKLFHKVNEIIDVVNGLFTGAIDEYINQNLAKFVVNATYDEGTETLIMNISVEE